MKVREAPRVRPPGRPFPPPHRLAPALFLQAAVATFPPARPLPEPAVAGADFWGAAPPAAPPSSRRADRARRVPSRALLVGLDCALLAVAPVLVSGWMEGGGSDGAAGIQTAPARAHGRRLDRLLATRVTLSTTPSHHVQVEASKRGGRDFPFHPVALVAVTEAVKAVAALAVLAARGETRRRKASGAGGKRGGSVPPALPSLARHAPLLIPAALYALNNYLKFALQRHVDPAGARVLSSLKIVLAAGLSFLLLGRRFSRAQCSALAVLVLGVAVNSLDGGGLAAGAAAVAAASVAVPSLAAVLSERGLKRDPGASLASQNAVLFGVGAALNAAALAALAAAGRLPRAPLAGVGSSPAALALVAVLAAQGVTASYFYKHFDTVAKKHSASLATVGTGLLAAATLGAAPPARFWVAAALIAIATRDFYSACPTCSGKGKPRAARGLLSLTASPARGDDPEAGRLLAGRTSPARRV